MLAGRFTLVVFLLLIPVAGATGLGVDGSASGHGFSRAAIAQEREGVLTPEVLPRGEAELESAVRAQPENWELHVELIEASAAAGHLPERTRWYEVWLITEQSAEPTNARRRATLHAVLGTCYWRAGDLRGARAEYRQAVRLEPENPAFTEALRTLEAQTGWQLRDSLIVLLFVLVIVAYVALRRRRWTRVLRG